MPHGFDKLVAAAVVAVLISVAATGAQAQAPVASGPVCIYESESYSDGAYLCIRKGLMLGCASSGGRANWSVVADRELSNLCGGDYRARLAPRQRHAQRRRAPEVAAAPPQVSAKCFSFNGKSYCE